MKLNRIAVVVGTLIVACTLAAQAPYTPPVLPPVFSNKSVTDSTQVMLDVNANVSSITGVLLKHDADLYSPNGLLATLRAAIPPSVLPTATSFQIPACRFSGVYGNIAQVTEPSRATDGGCDVGWLQPGERLIYTFYVPQAGNYAVTASVASPLTTGAFHFEVDGMPVTPSTSVPNTGGWYVWKPIPVQPFFLSAGIVTVVVVVESAAQNNLFNLHWMNYAKQ